MNSYIKTPKKPHLVSAMVTGYKVNLKWISARGTHSITNTAKLVFTTEMSDLMTVGS